jgi:hypothetical protein
MADTFNSPLVGKYLGRRIRSLVFARHRNLSFGTENIGLQRLRKFI